MPLMVLTDFDEATHVIHHNDRYLSDRVKKIWGKYGMDDQGRLAKPSEGFFGCLTDEGELIDGWKAWQYFKAQDTEAPRKFPSSSEMMDAFPGSRLTKRIKREPVEYDSLDVQREE